MARGGLSAGDAVRLPLPAPEGVYGGVGGVGLGAAGAELLGRSACQAGPEDQGRWARGGDAIRVALAAASAAQQSVSLAEVFVCGAWVTPEVAAACVFRCWQWERWVKLTHDTYFTNYMWKRGGLMLYFYQSATGYKK